jgi:chromosome segregation ATPase
MATNSDQDDIIAQNERLTSQLAASRQNATELRTQLETLRVDYDRSKTELLDARSSVTTLQQTLSARTKERDDLQAENESLKTKLADFDKAVAAKVTQLGFAKAASVENPAQQGETVNYTERCRAAKGC